MGEARANEAKQKQKQQQQQQFLKGVAALQY